MNLGPTTLRQWADARAHLSKAIQTYVSATAFLESMCTPLLMESIPDALNTIEDNIEIIEREQLDLQRAQATLKKKRNSFTSPIDVLPSEMLACIFTTAATPVSEFNSSEHYVKRTLSRVCSRWRHIALEVCPIWSTVSLVLEIDSVARDELEAAVITLSDLPNRPIRVPVHRQDNFDDTLLVQKTLDTIAPYIRQLGHLDLNTDNIEQLQPFLDLWLEKGTPSSLRELCLSADEAALAFSEAGSHLSKSLRHLELLKLSSVGLDWSSVSFKRLTSMTLSDLPPFCCPTLVQLARMLSTCHDLQTLRLERITILASPGVAPLEPVELKYLERLSLEEVDTSRILSILSPGHCELRLELQDLNNDADMLESLRRFAGQANIRELDLMFSETRSDATLAQLLHLTTGPLLDLIYLKLIDMDLRNSELDVLAGYSLMTLPPASISDTSGLPRLGLLEFQYCTIHTAPASFHNAITAFPWITLRLANCRHSLTTQDENNINEVLEPISDTSDFGIQLSELLPDRVSFFTW